MSPTNSDAPGVPRESRKKKFLNRMALALLGLGLMAAVIGLHSIFFSLDLPREAQLPYVILLLLAMPALAFAAYVKMHRASLRAKLISSFLVVSLAPLAVLAYLDQRATFEALTTNTKQALYAAAKQTASRIDAFIQANMDTVRTDSMLPEFQEFLGMKPDSPEYAVKLRRVLNILGSLRRRDMSAITSFALLDKDGVDVADTFGLDIGLNKSQRDYFEVPLRTGLPYVSSVSVAGVSNLPSLYFSSPVRADSGEILGVLRIRYNASVLQSILGRERGIIGEDSFAVLVDENLVRLADGARPDYVLTPVAALPPSQRESLLRERRIVREPSPPFLPAFERGLAEGRAQPFFLANLYVPNGKPNQNAVAPLDAKPWFLVFSQPRDEYLSGLVEQIRNAGIVSGIMAVAVILAAMFLARRISLPITRLTEAAGRVAEGDRDVTVSVSTGDELELLASSFNRMTQQLRELFERQRRSHEELEQKVEARTAALQRANEQLLALDRLKSSFLSSASHELRTPLTSILGFAKLCAKTFARHFQPTAQTPGLQRKANVILENLGIIEKEGERLTRLVNDLLDLNKIESGKMEWRDEDLDMTRLLADNVRSIQGLFSDKPQVSLETHIPGLLPTVRADADRISQVTLNLLNNAAKFTQQGHVRLTARTVFENWLEVRVEDTGQGVSKADLEHIFEKFYQTGQTNQDSDKPKGTGLGLAICRQIIEHYGGRVWAESAPGAGSVFIFQLPGKLSA